MFEYLCDPKGSVAWRQQVPKAPSNGEVAAPLCEASRVAPWGSPRVDGGYHGRAHGLSSDLGVCEIVALGYEAARVHVLF